jgi:hypothetical protein
MSTDDPSNILLPPQVELLMLSNELLILIADFTNFEVYTPLPSFTLTGRIWLGH